MNAGVAAARADEKRRQYIQVLCALLQSLSRVVARPTWVQQTKEGSPVLKELAITNICKRYAHLNIYSERSSTRRLSKTSMAQRTRTQSM